MLASQVPDHKDTDVSAVIPVCDDEDLDLAASSDGSERIRDSGKREGGCDETIGIEAVTTDDLYGFLEVLPTVSGRSLNADLVLLDHGQVDGRRFARSSQHHHRAPLDRHLDGLSEGCLVRNAVENDIGTFAKLTSY